MVQCFNAMVEKERGEKFFVFQSFLENEEGRGKGYDAG